MKDLKIRYKNEYRFFQALAKCGRCVATQADEFYNINYKKLQRYVKTGWLEKEAIVWNNKATYCYRLTDKAKNWVKDNIPALTVSYGGKTVTSLYKPSTMGTSHDVMLFDIYSRKSDIEQDLAITEGALTRIFGQLSWTSPPDMFIPDETGGGTAIEVITQSYTSSDKLKKVQYIKEIMRIPVNYNTYFTS